MQKDNTITLLKAELKQTSYEKDKQNSILKSRVEELQKQQQQSQIKISQLQESNTILEKECRYRKNGLSADIIIDYRLGYFTNRDYALRAKSYAYTASEYWVVDVLKKRTSIYKLGNQITVRDVPFGWKIEENTSSGYCQIYVHGMTSFEQSSLKDHPIF